MSKNHCNRSTTHGLRRYDFEYDLAIRLFLKGRYESYNKSYKISYKIKVFVNIPIFLCQAILFIFIIYIIICKYMLFDFFIKIVYNFHKKFYKNLY